MDSCGLSPPRLPFLQSILGVVPGHSNPKIVRGSPFLPKKIQKPWPGVQGPSPSDANLLRASHPPQSPLPTDPNSSPNQLVAVPSISLLLLHLVMLFPPLSLQDHPAHCPPVTSTCPNYIPTRLGSNVLSPQEASPYSIPNGNNCSHLKTLRWMDLKP